MPPNYEWKLTTIRIIHIYISIDQLHLYYQRSILPVNIIHRTIFYF